MVDWNALNGMMADDENNPLALLAGSAGINVFFLAAAALGASVIAAVLLYPLFAGIMLRWWISGLRFGTVTVQCRLTPSRVKVGCGATLIST